uniref:Uncharacterized protein n=1 Tax=Sphaerodactylus townsendi TaxID=933632 RepID=A0ACB8EI53_9SAUR
MRIFQNYLGSECFVDCVKPFTPQPKRTASRNTSTRVLHRNDLLRVTMERSLFLKLPTWIPLGPKTEISAYKYILDSQHLLHWPQKRLNYLQQCMKYELLLKKP